MINYPHVGPIEEKKGLLTDTVFMADVGQQQRPMNIDMVLYHHPCSDGFAAAFAAWLVLGDRAQYLPVTYERNTDAQAPDVTGKRVVMLDVAFSASKMLEMVEKSESFMVLDHHVSAEKALEALPVANKCFQMKQSGCTLAWNYFHPRKPVPMLLRYVEDKDIWRWAMKCSKEFSASWRHAPMDFEFCKQMLEGGSAAIWNHISAGRAILGYQKILIADAVGRAQLRQLKLQKGWRVKVINTTILPSEIGAALASQPDCDVSVMWSYDHSQRQYRISMRSDHDSYDVSQVCSAMGGGGHKRAGGFSFAGESIEELFV